MAKFKCKICGQTFEADKMPEKCPICQADSSNIEEVHEPGAEPKAKKKGLDTSGNVYTVCYAAVMVIIVAFLLAFVSSSLSGIQNANVENDTKGQILTALGYDKATVNVGEVYEQNVKDSLWDKETMQMKPYEGKFKTSYGGAIKSGELHVFTATAADGSKAYVIPVTGRGLWGGLWGYIAIDQNKQTVLGTYFYHEGETAGLGALIGDRPFQEQFIGKPIFAEGVDGIALTVVKNGTPKKGEYEIDGVTGATLTSNGVAGMIQDGLGAYITFINNK